MSKKTIVVLGAVLLAGTAYAADLPRRAVPPAPSIPAPTFSWNGPYAGLNAGYAWGRDTFSNTAIGAGAADLQQTINSLHANRVRLSSTGVTGGAQIGYNYQVVPNLGFIIGVEADAQYVGLNRKRKLENKWNPTSGDSSIAFAEDDIYRARSSTDALGTIRGRVGYAFDRVFVYGTGGVAFGDVRSRSSLSEISTTTVNGTAAAPTINSYNVRTKGIRTGYVYGGGIEFALPKATVPSLSPSSAITLRIEYLRYDLGKQSLTALPTIRAKESAEGNLVRAAVNYKFSGF